MKSGEFFLRWLCLGLKIKILCLAGLLISSCGNYSDQKNQETPETPVTGAEELAAKDFNSVRDAVFERCIACHAEKFSNYQTVFADLADISSRITSNNMPKSGPPLSDHQKRVLARWMANGAPEFQEPDRQPLPPPNRPPSNPPAKPPLNPPPMTLEPTWQSIQANIITQKKCSLCHNPTGEANFLDLTTYAAALAMKNIDIGNGILIDIADAENSQLILRLQDEEDPMPPKEAGVSRLTKNEVDVLIQWIRLGLPERPQ